MFPLIRRPEAAARPQRWGSSSRRGRKTRSWQIEVLEGRALLSSTVIDTIDFSPSRTGVIAANAATNRVYAAAEDVPGIRVIDSVTDAVGPTIPTLGYQSLDVNPATNRIYVSQAFAGSVRIIDGATNSVL